MTYDHYVDLQSEQWTKRLKQIAYVKFIIKIAILIFEVLVAISIAYVLKELSTYLENPDLEMNVVWTNSQITAFIMIIFMTGVLIAFSKMISRFIKRF